MKKIIPSAVLIMLLSSCTGGGDTVVSGIGNSGNHFGMDAPEKMLAQAFSEAGIVPMVSDDDLLAAYEHIRQQALEGDIESALVLYHLAAKQRAPKEEE